ncbi:sensor histidine kinase [Candidatus Hodarchaeum mangrovi]
MSQKSNIQIVFTLFTERARLHAFLNSSLSHSATSFNLLIFQKEGNDVVFDSNISNSYNIITYTVPKSKLIYWKTKFHSSLESISVGSSINEKIFYLLDFTLIKPTKGFVKFIEQEISSRLSSINKSITIFSLFLESSMSNKTTIQMAMEYPFICLNNTNITPNFFYDAQNQGKFPKSFREFYQPIQILIEELSKRSLELESLNKEIFLLSTQNSILESTVSAYISQEKIDKIKSPVQADIVSLLKYKDLKEKFDQKSQMLYTITHDLKSPLAAIQGFAEILKQGLAGPITDEMDKHLGIIISNSKRLARMIGSILEYERYDSSDYEITKERLNISEVFSEVKMSLLPQMISRGQKIEIFASDQLEIMASKELIIRAVQNLVDNAVKYSPPEKGEIKMFAEEVEIKGKITVKITIKDNGFGFTKESLRKVFEPFTKFEPGSQSTGLGLSITKKIIEDIHGGSITINSPGRNLGTTVVIILPKF